MAMEFCLLRHGSEAAHADLCYAVFLLTFAPAMHLAAALSRVSGHNGRSRHNRARTAHLLLWVLSLDLRHPPDPQAAQATHVDLGWAARTVLGVHPGIVAEALAMTTYRSAPTANDGLLAGLHAFWLRDSSDFVRRRLPEPLRPEELPEALRLLLTADRSTRQLAADWIAASRSFCHREEVQRALLALPVCLAWADASDDVPLQQPAPLVAHMTARLLFTGTAALRVMAHAEVAEPEWLNAVAQELSLALTMWFA
jgi:hypothetical protein